MPKFICKIQNCKYWSKKKGDCKKKNIIVKPRSDDFDVTIACTHQDTSKRDFKERWTL